MGGDNLLEFNKVYNESCLDTLSKMDDNSVDLIIADPPYYKVVKEEWDNQWETEEEYIEWCILWIKESLRVLKNTGNLVIWGQLGEKYITYAGLIWEIQKQIPSLIRKKRCYC